MSVDYLQSPSDAEISFEEICSVSAKAISTIEARMWAERNIAKIK